MDAFCKTIELGLNQSLPGLDFINVNASSFLAVCLEKETLELDSATEAKYSGPMVLIGWYIFVASCICLCALCGDIVVNRLTTNKFWPVKVFSLNAVSLTVIAVAMKLPMDLTSPMPSETDQVAKVGGLGFLCILMSNLLPSLAVTDNRSLLANVTALSILVITVVVNVGIQIGTQVITHMSFHPLSIPPFIVAYIYMGMLLFLLILFISSAITIPTLKEVLERKYQATLNDQNLQQDIIFNVEKLRHLLKRHWIMADTSSLQFVMASTPLSSASGIVCSISIVMQISLSWHLWVIEKENKSAYKRSSSGIYAIQAFGVVGWGVVLVYRSFAVLWFKLSANQGRNHFSVFKVDKYWTQQLCEWKDNPLRLSLFVEVDFRMKNIILSSFIGFQRAVVVLCQIIELIPIGVIIFLTHCSSYFKSLKALLFTPPATSSGEDTDEDLSNYVLSIEDNVQVTKHLFKRSLDSMNRRIRSLKRVPHKNLLKLLEKSGTAFERLGTFEIDQIQSPRPLELVNSWSLPIISLTCIAIAIPNIDKGVRDNMLVSVGEGLFFTHLVEGSLNKASEHVNIQRATRTLWREVRDKQKWLDTTLKRSSYTEKTPTEIIELFSSSSKKILNEFKKHTNGEPLEKEKLPRKLITANSMYRIAQTIMITYASKNLDITKDELFSQLCGMIVDILAACLTNLQQVMIMKCHESAIEKREDSVLDAVCLFAWTSEIIKKLETRELPNMDPEKRRFIDEWLLYFQQP